MLKSKFQLEAEVSHTIIKIGEPTLLAILEKNFLLNLLKSLLNQKVFQVT